MISARKTLNFKPDLTVNNKDSSDSYPNIKKKMPYIILSTQIRVEKGPTVVGDELADPSLMQYLGATLTTQLGNDFSEYISPDPPRVLLDKLELKGYKVIAMSGIGQTCVWTLNKPPEFE